MGDQKYTHKSLPCAFALVELAKVFDLQGDVPQAIEHQRRALDIFSELNYEKLDYFAQQQLTLS